MLNRLVARDFAQDAAIATTDDEHTLRAPMRQYGHMGEHLVIDELVALCDLRDSVQRHHAAEESIVEDHQMLLACRFLIVHLIGTEGADEPLFFIEGFHHPASGKTAKVAISHQTIPSPRKCSPTRMSDGVNAARRTSIALRGSSSPHMNTTSATESASGQP